MAMADLLVEKGHLSSLELMFPVFSASFGVDL